MDAQQFLAEFGHIANAPGGVTRLRELIFSLASAGKLLADGKPLEATHLDKIADFVMGQAPPGNECNTRGTGTIFVKTGEFGELYPIVREWTTKPLKFAKQGDVLICVVGATVGKLNLAIDCAIGRSVAAIRPRDRLNTKYLYFMLMPFTLHLRSGSRGSAQGVIGKAELSAVKLRVPSEEEQSRIVAKVDELMALCDKLETQQQERRKLQNNLRLSTLQAVATASSPHELQTTWTRLADNFGRLFQAPEDVSELRNLVLALAANGFLSEPHIDDGDPAENLKRVSEQQKEELSARELREISALPEPSYEKKCVRLALGYIVKLISGQHLSPEEYNARQEGIPYITGPAEFRDHRPSPTKWTHKRRAVARAGDVLITVKGSGVGKTARCDLEELAISRQLMAIRRLGDLNGDFLSICIDSAEGSFQEQKFGIAIPGIGRDEVLGLQVRLPSIEEQGRIVKRVSELMRFCDLLESQLHHSSKLSAQIAITAVSSITGIATEQKEESMKAPQTELIAPLRLGQTPDIKAQAPLATILARHHGEMPAKDLWQRFGGEIDAFYAQLKTEVAHGWILEPAEAEMREKHNETAAA
jgi:type I restriction enzyme S subunit